MVKKKNLMIGRFTTFNNFQKNVFLIVVSHGFLKKQALGGIMLFSSKLYQKRLPSAGSKQIREQADIIIVLLVFPRQEGAQQHTIDTLNRLEKNPVQFSSKQFCDDDTA